MVLKTICGLALLVAASGSLQGSPSQSAPGDEEQVRATDDRRADALKRGDTAPLREIYADDYSLVTAAGAIRSKADQIGELESGQLHYQKFQVTERTIRMYGDVAIVLSRDTSNIVLKGKEVGGDLRATRVYKKAGAGWRLIATHATPILPSRP